MDIVRSRGGERKGLVRPCERCADVLLPKFAEVADLCLPRGHASGTDSSRSGGKLVMCIDLSEIHENILADDALSIVVGEEWSAVRGDASNDVGIVETHETKGRGEALLVLRLTGVTMGGWIVRYALGDGGGIVEGMIGRVTELRGRNGSRIAVINGFVVAVPKVVKVRGVGKVLRDGERIAVLRVGTLIVVDVIAKVIVIEAILPGSRGAPSRGRKREAGVIMGGGRRVGGGGGIGVLVVADGLRVGGHGRLLVWIINYAGTVEELCLSPITSRIVGIGGMRVGRRIEGVCREGEIGMRDGGVMVIHWSATKTG